MTKKLFLATIPAALVVTSLSGVPVAVQAEEVTETTKDVTPLVPITPADAVDKEATDKEAVDKETTDTDAADTEVEDKDVEDTEVVEDDAEEGVAVKYADITEAHWAYEAITKATKLGIVQGTKVGDVTYFMPDAEVTRADAVIQILRSLGIDFEEFEGESFADAKGTTYESAVAKAKELGIVVGYGADEFRGEDKISREHLAVFMARAYVEGYETEGTLKKDVEGKRWTSSAIIAMVELGILDEYADGTVKPTSKETNAKVITMIMKAVESDSPFIKKSEKIEVEEAETEDVTPLDEETTSEVPSDLYEVEESESTVDALEQEFVTVEAK